MAFVLWYVLISFYPVLQLNKRFPKSLVLFEDKPEQIVSTCPNIASGMPDRKKNATLERNGRGL